MSKTNATIEKQMVLKFGLPGVETAGHSWSGGGAQMEQQLKEHWILKVSEGNVDSTIECLVDVVETLRRFRDQLR